MQNNAGQQSLSGHWWEWPGVLRRGLCMFTARLQMSSNFAPFVSQPDSSH